MKEAWIHLVLFVADKHDQLLAIICHAGLYKVVSLHCSPWSTFWGFAENKQAL